MGGASAPLSPDESTQERSTRSRSSASSVQTLTGATAEEAGKQAARASPPDAPWLYGEARVNKRQAAAPPAAPPRAASGKSLDWGPFVGPASTTSWRSHTLSHGGCHRPSWPVSCIRWRLEARNFVDDWQLPTVVAEMWGWLQVRSCSRLPPAAGHATPLVFQFYFSLFQFWSDGVSAGSSLSLKEQPLLLLLRQCSRRPPCPSCPRHRGLLGG